MSAIEDARREALAHLVDMMGYEFAARFIRDDVCASGSVPLSYVMDEKCTAEFLADFRELASDVEYVRVTRDKKGET